jgi:hypothetical protein
MNEGGRKALEAERAAAKKAKAERDATAKQLEGFLEASKTDEERRQDAIAKAEAKATAATQRIVTAELRAALKGVVDDPNSVIEDLNLARFIDADGDVDEAAVAALQAKWTRINASAAAPRAPRPDASQASAANGMTKRDPASEFQSFLQSAMTKSSG